MLGGSTVVTTFGAIMIWLGSASIAAAANIAVVAAMIAVVATVLAQSGRMPKRENTRLAARVTHMVFNRDSELLSIWVNNTVHPVIAYRCYRVFGSYLELRLSIAAQERCAAYPDATRHGIDLNVDRSRVDAADLCRLRRAFLCVPESSHAQR